MRIVFIGANPCVWPEPHCEEVALAEVEGGGGRGRAELVDRLVLEIADVPELKVELAHILNVLASTHANKAVKTRCRHVCTRIVDCEG